VRDAPVSFGRSGEPDHGDAVAALAPLAGFESLDAGGLGEVVAQGGAQGARAVAVDEEGDLPAPLEPSVDELVGLAQGVVDPLAAPPSPASDPCSLVRQGCDDCRPIDSR
jgi:hypothetical protein